MSCLDVHRVICTDSNVMTRNLRTTFKKSCQFIDFFVTWRVLGCLKMNACVFVSMNVV